METIVESKVAQAESIFEQALCHFGVSYKNNRRSIILQYCPKCHKGKNAVWMYRPDQNNGRTGGQCWSCAYRYSSYSYLVDMGHEPKQVLKHLKISKHSPDLSPGSWILPDFEVPTEGIEEVLGIQEKPLPLHYIKVVDYLDHPAAEYAVKRGAVWPLSEEVFIDPMTNSVAFPVFCRGVCVGFQRRFVNPGSKLKTLTDPGIPKSRSFIYYGNPANRLCVVEGPFDALAAAWMGFFGVCTMGCTFSIPQAQEIALMALDQDFDNPCVFIGYDADVPGEQGARNLAKLLDAYGVNVYRVTPKHQLNDLNEVLMLHSGVDFLKATEVTFARDLISFNLDWAWDIPYLPEFDTFTRMVSLTKEHIGDTRAQDKTVTNDYVWADFKTDTTKTARNRRKRWNDYKNDPSSVHKWENIQKKQVKNKRKIRVPGSEK